MHLNVSFRTVACVAPLFVAGSLCAQETPEQPKTYEGTVALGFSKTSGNANATTTNVANKLQYRMRGWGVKQDLAFFYGEADNKVNANFWTAGLRGERKLTSRIGLYVTTRYDRNVLQGIASRFEEGAGMDILAIDAPKDRLTFALGMSAFQQTLTEGSVSSFSGNYPAARAAMDYKHSFTKVAFFQQTAEFLPNLSDSEAYLVNAESSVVAPLAANLGIKIGLLVRYNAQPPFRDDVRLKTTDTFFTSGLTYSF
jgi:putative salt-induced outer membrane protein